MDYTLISSLAEIALREGQSRLTLACLETGKWYGHALVLYPKGGRCIYLVAIA